MKSAFCCTSSFSVPSGSCASGISLLFMQCTNRSGGQSISSVSIRKAFACALSLS